MSESAVEIVVVAGACSSGLTWKRVADLRQLRVLTLPDVGSVPEMAEVLAPELSSADVPRVLVGASLGAMVALELVDRVRVDVAVLVAAGLGITVEDAVLERLRASDGDVLMRVARSSLAAPDNSDLLELAVADLRSRGRDVLIQHLSVLKSYRASRCSETPETFVVWGEGDRSVPLQDHLELARALGGVLFPVRGAGHLPFLENPHRVAGIIGLAAQRAMTLAADPGPAPDGSQD